MNTMKTWIKLCFRTIIAHAIFDRIATILVCQWFVAIGSMTRVDTIITMPRAHFDVILCQFNITFNAMCDELVIIIKIHGRRVVALG